jgi:hypothetical protein
MLRGGSLLEIGCDDTPGGRRIPREMSSKSLIDRESSKR